MADAILTAQAESERVSRPGFLRTLFLRNLSAKIAALPMIITVLVVFVGCSVWSIVYSFTNSGSLPSGKFVGWAQYERLFHTARFIGSAKNLAMYGVMSLVFTMVIGFLLAVLMDQKIRFENTFRTILLYPFALSFIVTGLVWQWIMNPNYGVEKVLHDWGFTNLHFDLLNNGNTVIYGLVIAGLWQGTGFVMVLMLAGLRGIDEEIWKAARVDGIPTWRTYLQIVLPMMRGVIITTLVIVGSGIVRLYDLVIALTQGGPGFASDVPAKYVYDYMFGRANLGQGLAASTVMLLTVVIILIPWMYLEFGQKKNK